jgi:biopolymer transport protein TolR
MDIGDESSDPMSLADIRDRIAKILSQRTDREVLVRGDEHVEYGTVVRLMAQLQAAGASNVGLITEAPSIDE